MSRKPPIFKVTDVRKAFQAARDAGINARVDIARDGKLSIIPMAPEAPAPETIGWEKALGKPPA
ncbi:MAG: hypothetical protein M3Z96_09040 [Pseudomonadota bacterium]|nr:hypothetical protein [Pseudomonadota bacterium]